MTDQESAGHSPDVPASNACPAEAEPAMPTALEALYRQHASFVWRVVRRMGVPESAAEDVVQEVFLVARRRLPEYEGRGAPTSWLYAIARGVSANHRRGRARAERKLRVVEPPDARPTPEDELSRADVVVLVRRFIERLPPAQREVFVLADVEGIPCTQIAGDLGLNLNVVYSRLRLARQKFRRYVAAARAQQVLP